MAAATMELPIKFLNDLSEESITSKSQLLTLAFLLGLENPLQTVDRYVHNNPKDIKQATLKFLCMWNNVEQSEHKLDKLKVAYRDMNQEGLYSRVFQKHNPTCSGPSDQKQIVLAQPDGNSSSGEISFLPHRINTFLLEICQSITSVSELQTVAISCGCYPKVDAAVSNWPTDILQAVFQVILTWWFGSSENEEVKISRLEDGFKEMKKPVVFIGIASKTEMAIGQGDQGQQRQVEYRGEGSQAPQGELLQNMQSNYGTQPRFPDEQGAHSVGNIGAGDQHAAALLRENDSNDMDTSEDITSGRAAGFSYHVDQSVSASVPVNPSSGPDLQNRQRQYNLLGLNEALGVPTDLKTSTIQNASQGSVQQLTQYSCDKKVGRVLIVNNICGEFRETENSGPGKHEMDTDQLRIDFVHIGCDVSYHKDLHGDDMRSLRDDIRNFDFNEYNMFWCVIVGHCDQAGTLRDARRDVGVPFNDLVVSATENSTLRGKPKVFIKCACRGIEINSGSVSLLPDNFGTRRSARLVDVAIAYPTDEGHQYMLNTKPGHSNPIEALYQCLRIDRIPRPRTLDKLFKNWKRILNETEYIAGDGEVVKQTPGVYDLLRDYVYY